MGIDLRGRPIAIAGASSGIGRATAIACARAGMPVVLGARRVEKLEAVAAEIRAGGGQATALAVDVIRPEDCRALVEATRERFGSVYAAFANAGYGIESPVRETSDQAFRDILETNFFGTLNLVRPALELMLAAGQGHILICSSCLSKVGVPFYGAYSASKACQDHIARALRAEVAGSGVRVSSVHPIGTRTEFFQEADRRSGGRSFAIHTPERFMQRPERVARAIVACLRRPRGEVWTSTSTRLAFAAAVAFPAVADWAMRSFVRKRTRIVDGIPGQPVRNHTAPGQDQTQR
jgi:short-subunit dehydrogenase